MRNLLLTISFDGTDYHGWQVQENAVTVQQTLQDALEHICSKRDNIIGCSRTDAGVHANMYCCNVRTESVIDCRKLVGALNAVLPRDISAIDCREVDFDFHARYDCKSKEYIYKIWNSPNKNPFFYNYSLHYKYPLDEKFLSEQARAFIGTHYFDSFCAAGSSVEDTQRTVMNACVEREGDMVIFKVEADGFLYNMVRIMTGTLIDIARKKIPADSIEQIILSRNRSAAGYTAPAHGLYLNKIHY
ncbi:MAG: tRNA pseudouridine(38-40) synthase TruA [Ruminococcaceae bacterium]|nr:tRNA pseudouridine(38-40) synthase TruA [Oscillospiraceae bacterium]